MQNAFKVYDYLKKKKKKRWGDFPGGTVVKISGSFRGAGSIPDWGAKIPHVSRPKPPEHEKQRQAINAGEGVEKREPSYTVGGNAN